MAERSPARPAQPNPGPLARGLATLTGGLVWLMLSLVFSILLEWAGMLWWWPEQGTAHSRAMLEAEIGYLNRDFRQSLLTGDPVSFARTLADTGHHALFELTGIAAFVRWVSPPPRRNEGGLRPRLHALYRHVAEFLDAAMNITQVFAVRLALLVLALPVFGLFALVGLVDGLVRRDLRRWGGGRESSFLYHYAKQSLLPLVTLAWVVYLALPFSVQPSLVVLPFAGLLALSVSLMAGMFKKYL